MRSPAATSCCSIFAIELVAVPVPFVDFRRAVGAIRERIRLDPAGPRAQAHGAAHLVHAQQLAQFVNHAMRRLRIEFRAVGVGQARRTLRAYSIVAHCIPRQMPKNGTLCSRAY